MYMNPGDPGVEYNVNDDIKPQHVYSISYLMELVIGIYKRVILRISEYMDDESETEFMVYESIVDIENYINFALRNDCEFIKNENCVSINFTTLRYEIYGLTDNEIGLLKAIIYQV
jgi:hypothetical protein